MSINEIELQPLLKADALQALNIPNESIPADEKKQQAIDDLSKLVAEANNLSDETKSSEDSLNKILASEKLLNKVKEDLNNIVDAVAKNPSLITQISKSWGELPSWQKYSGAMLGVPFLIVGFSTLAIVPILVGSTVLAIYTAGGVILEDHYQKTIDITESLKKGILSLADVLGLVIKALDKIRKDLAVEVEKFRQENIKLSDNISILGNQIDSLTVQTQLFIETEQVLKENIVKLESTASDLKNSVDVQGDLLNKTLSELDYVKSAYEKSKEQLTEKILELTTVKIEMGREVEKAKKVALTLKGAVDTLSGAVIEDNKQKKEFQEKLNTFLSDKEKSFSEVTDRICQAEQELVRVKEELKRSNERYEMLLNRQEDQVLRLEQLDRNSGVRNSNEPANVGVILKKQGFYSGNNDSINNRIDDALGKKLM